MKKILIIKVLIIKYGEESIKNKNKNDFSLKLQK